ncbi:MAG: FAD-dependent oxidoreductase [Verrucomicrobia bacterium]|nr:FAD-dependent oxidoreductase [Verrucomicrobiota bacterium]
MLIENHSTNVRSLRTDSLACDFVIVGGGLAGTCAAIQAARAGLNVTLIQDRPVLGGNASGEVRLWILGATSHMGNNNRWAREGGIIDEILVENMFRNPEGNPLLLDALLLEKVSEQSGIRLLLNTAVFEVEKSAPDRIAAVKAFCSQNSTLYHVQAPLFCDASGDGIAGFLAGAAFRIGAECRSEFGEGFAPEQANSELLGHSIYFYSKDVGKPVRYVPPSFALMDITKIPRFRDFKAGDSGCRLWWIEWGGLLDTIHDSEQIKWELWRIVYGVWNHIKNSGEFPEAENLTLEWVGTVPGKRESRRFEGDYILSQSDLVEQRKHPDVVSFGGWAIDVHPPEGVFSPNPGCLQWHTKGIYGIPYRCLYSRNIENLFLAGRIISSSHVAFASTRVMATCALTGQAAGMAAALSRKHTVTPRELGQSHLAELQAELLKTGNFIPGVPLKDPLDKIHQAKIVPSSELVLRSLPAGGATRLLDVSGAMLLPLKAGAIPHFTVILDVAEKTEITARLMTASRSGNHTPDIVLDELRLELMPGDAQHVTLAFDAQMPHDEYAFFALAPNPAVAVHLSEQRLTGVLSVWQKFNRSVAKSSRQDPPDGIGIDAFEFWLPERRPGGKNFAFEVNPPIQLFSAENLRNGIARPTSQANAWVAEIGDSHPEVLIEWDHPEKISTVTLSFDTDFDHPMESVLMGHPERTMPFCTAGFRIYDSEDRLLYSCVENHHSQCIVQFDEPVLSDTLRFRFEPLKSGIPTALFAIQCL